MSEYQFYEFLAVDRPLDARQLSEVRSLSTRADITPTSFVNVYHWGNFRGDPRTLMERYYDAHLYLANWGTRELMLRLPAGLLAPDTVAAYCLTDSAAAWTHKGHVIIAVTRDGDGDDDFLDEDGHGRLGSIISVRSELAGGDLRLLYLAWLHSVAEGELGDEEVEPPVPANLGALSAGRLRHWLTTRTSIRPSTLRSYTEHVDSHLVPHLGRIRVGELTDRDVAVMFATLAATDNRWGRRPAPSTLHRIRATLRSALNAAIRD